MNQIDEMNHIEIEKIEKIEEKEEKEESIINLSPKSILEYEENDIYLFGVHIDNNVILTVSSISFLLFVTAEFIGAFASNSLSLLGDAGAMSIDVLTVSFLIILLILLIIFIILLLIFIIVILFLFSLFLFLLLN